MSDIYANYLRDPDGNTAPVISGDSADDDAKYVDLLLEESQPPLPAEFPREEDHGGNVGIAVPNRMICRTQQFTGRLTAPVLMLPADPNRKRIIFGSSASTYWADNASALPQPSAANYWVPDYQLAFTNIFSGNIELVGYTGALWVINAPNQGVASNWQVSIIAITE